MFDLRDEGGLLINYYRINSKVLKNSKRKLIFTNNMAPCFLFYEKHKSRWE